MHPNKFNLHIHQKALCKTERSDRSCDYAPCPKVEVHMLIERNMQFAYLRG